MYRKQHDVESIIQNSFPFGALSSEKQRNNTPGGCSLYWMGASYIAFKTFRYLGIDLFPERASDYFSSFTAVVNSEESKLAAHLNCKNQILLYSGIEKRIPSKPT